MPDRFYPNFEERAGQSDAAKLANLEAFKAALVDQNQDFNIKEPTPTLDLPEAVNRPLFSKIPRSLRYPVLAATAGAVSLVGAVACTTDSGSRQEIPQEPTNQGEVLDANITPVPSASAENTDPAKKEFKKAPDFTLKDKNGVSLSLHDLGNGPIIVQYSQEGACIPCRLESKKLSKIMKNYGSQGLVVLHVVRDFDPNYSQDMPILLDSQKEFAQNYNVLLANPGTIFIRDGKVVYTHLGYNDQNSDLDMLTVAFMAGKDLEGILPTPTPAPTVTPLPTRAPESERNNSAEVLNLGNFDVGIVDWNEYTNVMPNTRSSGLRTKHVVISAIARNKTEKWQKFEYVKPDFADGGVGIVGENGERLNYGVKEAPVIVDVVVPIDYEGIFSYPFAPYKDGTYRTITRLYQPEHHPSRLVPPGFGLPVYLDFEIPFEENVYDLEYYTFYEGREENKIIKKGHTVDNFALVGPDAAISDTSESLEVFAKGTNPDGSIVYVGDYSIKLLGSTKGNHVPGTALHDMLLFDIKNKLPVEKYPLGLSVGYVYLKDGRVVSLERGNPRFGPGEKKVVGVYLGTADPHADFPVTPYEYIDKEFDFDLKGAVVVLGVLGQWKAWEVPEGTNVPIGQGGE
ncbi:TPA: hypothetical protein DIV55_06505 [Patescibacteria group bacterium]|uniref:Thioredoxin domain-containing protein n=1 Tax=Candidatus Curtissbacteria bacterium GW2011_GWA1_40_16 TaxID=1618405 RepID=A0A0G0TUX1_9BACT|nr:MAG: hypothetical protein UT84_C0005G0031 [Candidatus Curtissbacteria bacterium GW2011_GWA1_40_16]HCS79355.1 hypothetical protein [Patescibacteria group bacterium]